MSGMFTKGKQIITTEPIGQVPAGTVGTVTKYFDKFVNVDFGKPYGIVIVWKDQATAYHAPTGGAA